MQASRHVLMDATGLPENWDRSQLVESLRPISEQFLQGEGGGLSAGEQSYCRFYGIDKENRVDGVNHYMGRFEASGFQLAIHYYQSAYSRARQHFAAGGYLASAGPVSVGAEINRAESFKGTAFVFHGYFDHTGLYGHIIEYLLRSGYDVVIYDLPGHGLSTGEAVAIDQFEQYKTVLEQCLSVCRGRVAKPWFAIGQSTGAAVLLEYVFSHRFNREETPFQHWVLLAPLLRPLGWKKLVWLHSLLGRFLTTWQREFTPNSHDAAFVQFLIQQDPLQVRAISVKWAGALRRWVRRMETQSPVFIPVTIIQGPEDGTVDWRYNIPRLKQMLPLASVNILHHGRHQLVNESPAIREKVFNLMVQGMDAHHHNNY